MFSRREVLGALGAGGLAGRLPGLAPTDLTYRQLGRTGRWVVPFGLGGQASLQWTPPGIEPEDIPVRAVELGMNYLDTANAYGTSQRHYGAAFDRLGLKPGRADYNAALRERLFVATKTGRRTAGDAVTELLNSLTVMFGDGRGGIPEGAYLDSIQIHNLTSLQEVERIYQPAGALAGLLDYRDGTNHTGLNPEGRRFLRHIGITGHQSSPVLMNALQRDEAGIVDTLLVALNANDRRYLPHQNNVLPLAAARGMGVIAMKVFADGVFYGKPGRFSASAGDVVLTVGRPFGVPSADLIRYPLSLAGVSCAIAGIGRIDRLNPEADQAAANLAASQLPPASPLELRRIEEAVAEQHGTSTNYFQERARGLLQPTGVEVERDADRVIVRWNTALAGAEPLRSYRIYAGDRLVASLPFQPQTTLAPLYAVLPAAAITAEPVRVVASEALPSPPRPPRTRTPGV